ncbi:MAG: CoA transferase, partial [Myxococcales bacterium]|nr:CoA transferase [Myxococcales bacterium]
EARQHAHAEARGLFGTHAHPAEGVEFLHQHPNPKLLPGAEPPPPSPAPRLGEHTRAVLTEFGAAEDEIAAVLRGG